MLSNLALVKRKVTYTIEILQKYSVFYFITNHHIKVSALFSCSKRNTHPTSASAKA